MWLAILSSTALSCDLSTAPPHYAQCAATRSVSPRLPTRVQPPRLPAGGACRRPLAGGPVRAQRGRWAGWCPGLRWRGRVAVLEYDEVGEGRASHSSESPLSSLDVVDARGRLLRLHIQIQVEVVIHLVAIAEIVNQGNDHPVSSRFYDPTTGEVANCATAGVNTRTAADE